jgi:Family of unknown function (DUF6481)
MKHREPTFEERMAASAKAKQAQLEKARAKFPANDPEFAEKQRKRQAIHAARDARVSERKAAKKREAEAKAEMEVARLTAQAAADEEKRKREIELEAERKAERDRRHAARKARQRK